MKRKPLKSTPCPIGRSLDIIGDWGTLLIVREALFGARRFSEFQSKLSLGKNTLTVRLKGLVASGILHVQPASDGSAFQEYVLSPRGRGLFPIIMALRQWGVDFLCKKDTYRTIVDAKNGKPLQRFATRADDGRILDPEDLIFHPAKQPVRAKRKP